MYRNQRAKHVVLLYLPTQYGSEAILRHIYEMSGAKWRIHVDPRKFNDYLCSDDLGDCTDADPELAQWIHACSWDKGDDDQKAARKKKNSAQKFFPREIPCQRDKTYEVASFVKFYCVLLSRFYLLPCISLQGTANQAICNVLQP